MDQKFFRVSFASNGDRQTIPETTPSDGSISFPSGWGNDYQKDPEVDANAKFVDRQHMNAILYAITNAIQQYQVFGFPEYITPADNSGEAFSYSSGAVVRYRAAADQPFKSYVSIVDDNASVPGADETKWQEFIYREATDEEMQDEENGSVLVTPRRLHPVINASIDNLQQVLVPYLVPVGFTGLWGASAPPPPGWIMLGDEFDVSANPKLAELFPDGKTPAPYGEFLRFFDPTGEVDGGRDVGSTQQGTNVCVGDLTQNAPAVVSFYNAADNNPDTLIQNLGGEPAAPLSGQVLVTSAGAGVDTSTAASVNAMTIRPRNIALMAIIKTDQADNVSPSSPTAIVITPRQANINAGGHVQFAASLFPAEFNGSYPISWAVTDPTLGGITSGGLYTATVGKTGTQTIIASISTGLTALVTLNQYIYLTGIVMAAVPTLKAGDTYNLALTYTPTGFTEPVDYASSDAQIASVIGGVVTGVSAGTVTISSTGRYSGVTASRQVTVEPKIVVEKYLQIDKNFSEIAESGPIAQEIARENLGLKDLATKDGLAAHDVGAVPQADETLGTENLNAVVSPGRKFQALTSNALSSRGYPVELAGALDVLKTTATGIRQIYYPYNSVDTHHRYCVDVTATTPVFSDWAIK